MEYGAGLRKISIIHCVGKTNINMDALSRNLQAPAPEEGIGDNKLHVAVVSSEPIINTDVLLLA